MKKVLLLCYFKAGTAPTTSTRLNPAARHRSSRAFYITIEFIRFEESSLFVLSTRIAVSVSAVLNPSGRYLERDEKHRLIALMPQ